MSDLSPVQELLADIGKRIAEDEAQTMERVNRLKGFADPELEDHIREEWHRFHMRVEPMRQQQEYILKQLTQIEACKPPKPMIVTVEEADLMGLSRSP